MLSNIERILEQMAHNALPNYIVPGITSSLIGGEDKGKVRVFEATRNARDFVTPHSHRFDFAAMVVRGTVTNTLYKKSNNEWDGDAWGMSTIDQVCGADGLLDYKHERSAEPTYWRCEPTEYREGETYFMRSDEIHSIVLSKNTILLFFEGPAVTTQSIMLEPWVNGKCIPTFRTESWMFKP